MKDDIIIEAFKQHNDRFNGLLKFLIDEVLTARQSERLFDAIDPTLKQKQLDKLKDIITKNTLGDKGDE